MNSRSAAPIRRLGIAGCTALGLAWLSGCAGGAASGPSSPVATTASTQTSRELVQELFAAYERGDSRPLFAHVADDVQWTITGTHSMSGTYHSKRELLSATYERLARVLAGPVRPTVQRILVDGDRAVVQWRGSATSVVGQPYDNEYCWILKLDGARIVEVTAYFDGGRLDELFRATEHHPR